jgi:hypothetical protein
MTFYGKLQHNVWLLLDGDKYRINDFEQLITEEKAGKKETSQFFF